jgi:hypothetical protein
MQSLPGSSTAREPSRVARALLRIAALGILLVGGEAAAQIALPDAYDTLEDQQLVVPAPGVLGNDLPIISPLAAALVTDVSSGVLALQPDGSFTYTPDLDFNGTDSFTYQADEGSLLSNVVTVTITVANAAPTFTSTPVAAVNQNAAYSYTAAATDLDGDTLTYAAPTLPSWLSFDTTTRALTGTPAQAAVGTHNVTLSVNDGTVTVQQSFTVTVNDVNDAPVAANDSYTVDEDDELDVNPAGGVGANDTDADGDNLNFEVVDDVSDGELDFNDNNGSFEYEPDAGFNGTDTFTYRADDGSALSNLATVTITVTATNDLPAFTSTPTTSVNEGVAYTYTATATDPDGDPLTYAAPTRPAWLTFNAGTRTLSGTPAQAQVGTHNVTLSVNDGTATVVQSFTITVIAVNEPPVFTSTAPTTVNEDSPYTYTATATDADGDTLTFTAPTRPAWLTFDAGTRTLSGTPTQAQVGTHNVTLAVNDGTVTVQQSFTITVVNVNDAPVFTSSAPTAVNEDTPYTYQAVATDADGNTLTYTAPTRPTWLAFNAGTRTLSGTPTQAQVGAHSVTLAVSDGTVTVQQSFTITVANVNDAPVFTSSAPTTGSQGTPYSYTAAATDSDGDTLTFAAPTLPAWLTFNAGTRTLSGTPARAQVGAHNVTLSVFDGTVTIQQSFTITVVNRPPTAVVIPLQVATENAPFTLALAPFFTDPESDPLSFAATGLPPGLAIDSATGVVSGIPTLGTSVGEYAVGLTVSDGINQTPAVLNLSVLRAGRADLDAAISVTPNPAAINTLVTWTLAVKNNAPLVTVGSIALKGVFVGAAPFTFDTPSHAGCTVVPMTDRTEIDCVLGPLAGSQEISVTVTGRGTLAGDLTGTVTTSIRDPEPVDETPANDTASTTLNLAEQVSSGPAQQITIAGARAAAAGDLNGDGFADLAVATGPGESTLVFLSIVDPTNTNKRTLSGEPLRLGDILPGNDIAIADLDRDGDLDLVAANGPGQGSRVFLNSGVAIFTGSTLGTAVNDSRAVAVGDVNGDTFPDIVFANASPNPVYTNQGVPGSYTQTDTLGNEVSVGVALLNLFGDPLPELVFANADGNASVYANSGGRFQKALDLLTGPTTSVAAADFNNDGLADLVFGRQSTAQGSVPGNIVFLNTSTAAAGFTASSTLGASPTVDVLATDVDLDGDADVVAINSTGSHQLYVNVGNATGTFALHAQQFAAAGALRATTGQLSVDTRLDLAVVGTGGGAIFLNDGAGNFGPGDTGAPTLQLLGEASVSLTVGTAYTDAGAAANDSIDGNLNAKVVATNPVDTAVLGTYTVTYNVTDLSGNAAAPISRTVRVVAREGTGGGGGGGAVGPVFLLLLALLAIPARLRSKRFSRSA